MTGAVIIQLSTESDNPTAKADTDAKHRSAQIADENVVLSADTRATAASTNVLGLSERGTACTARCEAVPYISIMASDSQALAAVAQMGFISNSRANLQPIHANSQANHTHFTSQYEMLEGVRDSLGLFNIRNDHE